MSVFIITLSQHGTYQPVELMNRKLSLYVCEDLSPFGCVTLSSASIVRITAAPQIPKQQQKQWCFLLRQLLFHMEMSVSDLTCTLQHPCLYTQEYRTLMLY